MLSIERDPKTQALAQILWKFHRVNDPTECADAVVAMGCKEPAIAKRATQLLLQKKAKILVCTGANSPLTANLPVTEAEFLHQAAISFGASNDQIMVEPRATNTKENVVNTVDLLQDQGVSLTHARIIWVHFPEMGLRVRQTARKQTAGSTLQHLVTHPEELKFRADPWQINLLLGNTDRLIKYGQIGDLEEVEIPDSVLQAYCFLKDLGYGQTVPEDPKDFRWRVVNAV